MTWDITGPDLQAERVTYLASELSARFEHLLTPDPRRVPTRAFLIGVIATTSEEYAELPEASLAFLLRKPDSRKRLLSAARTKRAELEPLSDRCDLDALDANGKLISALLCYDAHYGSAP